MRQFIFLPAMLALSSLCWGYTPMPIDLNNLNKKALNEEHALLNQLNQKLDDVVRAHGKLMAVRDLSLLKADEGIKDRSSQWMLDANDAVARLNALSSVLQSVEDFTDSTVRSSFQNQFNLLTTEIMHLSQEGLAIRNATVAALSDVESVRTFPSTYIDSGATDLIDGLNAYRQELMNVLTGIEASISTTITEKLLVAAISTRDATNAIIMQASFEFPELLAVVDEIERFLAEETEVTPRVTEVLDLNLKVKSLIQRNYIFTALDKVGKLESRGEVLKSEILSLNLPDDIEQEAIADIVYQVNDARSFADTYRPYAPYYVSTLYDNAKQLVPICRNYPEARSLYNCPLLGAVIGMDNAAVSTLEEDMLKFIEEKIRQVYAGPLGEVE